MALSVIIMVTGVIYLKPYATLPYVMIIGGLCVWLIGITLVLVAPSNVDETTKEEAIT